MFISSSQIIAVFNQLYGGLTKGNVLQFVMMAMSEVEKYKNKTGIEKKRAVKDALMAAIDMMIDDDKIVLQEFVMNFADNVIDSIVYVDKGNLKLKPQGCFSACFK